MLHGLSLLRVRQKKHVSHHKAGFFLVIISNDALKDTRRDTFPPFQIKRVCFGCLRFESVVFDTQPKSWHVSLKSRATLCTLITHGFVVIANIRIC